MGEVNNEYILEHIRLKHKCNAVFAGGKLRLAATVANLSVVVRIRSCAVVRGVHSRSIL